MTILDAVLQHGKAKPGVEAVRWGVSPDDAWTYAELVKQVRVQRNHLLSRGFRAGHRFVLLAKSEPRFIRDYLAVAALGGSCIPLDPRTPATRRRLIYAHAAPVAELSSGRCRPLNYGGVEQEEGDSIDMEEPVDLLFTSGTTGPAKAVGLTHTQVYAAAQNIQAFIQNDSADVEVLALPLSHSFGLGRIRSIFLVGGTVAIFPGFVPAKQLFGFMEAVGATGFSMVPSAWRVLRRQAPDALASFANRLRYVELGSAPMNPAEKRYLAELLPKTRVCMHYGLTEASRAAFQEFGTAQDLASVGYQSSLIEISVRNESGEVLEAGQLGEFCMRGQPVAREYWRQPERTSGSYHGEWFRSGDLGFRDDQGALFLQGRTSDLINVGGEKVTPSEVESVIEQHPEIAEAGCVGSAHPIAGEVVHAFVVTNLADEQLAELRKSLRSQLEPYKVPAVIERIERLPRTSSGKLQRHLLVEHLLRRRTRLN